MTTDRLTADLAASLGIPAATAERVAGTILGAIQVSASRERWTGLAQAFPGAQQFILKSAPPLGGRTGEMRAFVTELRTEAGAARLAAQLALLGLTPAQVSQAAETFVRVIQDAQGVAAAEQLLAELGGLKHLQQGHG